MSVTVRYDRNGGLIESPRKFQSVEFRRFMNEIGDATIVYSSQQGQCCEFVEQIHHFDRVQLFVDGEYQWHGWVSEVISDEDSGLITVSAVDAFGWFEWRTIHFDHSHVDEDLTNIFVDYFNDAMSVGNPGVELVTYPSGITATREVFADDVQYAIDPIDDLIDAGLEIIVVGNQIHVGKLDLGTISMSPRDFNSQPGITKRAEPFGNAFLGAGDDITSRCQALETDFPIVERIVEFNGVTDQAELDELTGRYCESQNVPMVFVESPAAGGMIPNCKLPLSDLLPSIRVIFDGSDVCGGFIQDHIISDVVFYATPETRNVDVGLSPIGPVVESFG